MNHLHKFKFRLYIAADTQNSVRATANLNAFCQEYLENRHEIEIVDVLREPKRAMTDGIFMTPTLIKLLPHPPPKNDWHAQPDAAHAGDLGLGSVSRVKTGPPSVPKDDGEEIFALVETLHRTEQRLEELTAGQVDSVVDREGQTFFLRRAQEELRFSEATRQAGILNALPAQIALLDTQGIIVSVNESWRRFATINALQSPGFGIGQNYLEICERVMGDCSEEAQAAAKGIRQVLQGEKKEFALEYPCHTPTEKCWFRLVVTPVNSGHLAGAVVMHVNITERMLAEESLRESEERFRGMFVGAAAGIAISTPKGRYLQANAAYCRMLGYSEAELQTMNFASITHPDDLHLNLEMRDELLAGQRESLIMEKRYVKKGGGIIWARTSVSATHSAEGELLTMIVIAEDITERKQAEEELGSKSALLEAQLNSTPDGIIIVDPEGKLVLQNQKMNDLWNTPKEIFDEIDHRKTIGMGCHPGDKSAAIFRKGGLSL